MKRILLGAALIVSAFSWQWQTLLAVEPQESTILVDVFGVDPVYATPAPDVVENLTGKLELLVFTYKSRGVCGACDLARPTLDVLCDVYPITRVYYDTARGYEVAHEYGVRALPTFVLVRRAKDGTAKELERFSGAYRQPKMSSVLESMFRRAGYDPDSDEQPTGARPIPKLTKAPRRVPTRYVWTRY